MTVKAHQIFIVLAVVALLLFGFEVSAQSNFKCGLQRAFTSGKSKSAMRERDSLVNVVYHLQNDKKHYIALSEGLAFSLDSLRDKYDEFMSASLSATEQLSGALKAKSDELKAKEKLLKEREQKLQDLQNIISRKDSITNALNNIVRNALLGFNSDELSVEMKNGKVYVSMSDKLLFRSGSAAVEEKGQNAIRKLAEVLQKNTDIDILIEGHTDNVPIRTANYKDNWDLSVARATSIVRMLSDDQKIIPGRLTASGKGEYFPVASNDAPEGRAKNRRTEIILSPKLDELMKLIQAN